MNAVLDALKNKPAPKPVEPGGLSFSLGDFAAHKAKPVVHPAAIDLGEGFVIKPAAQAKLPDGVAFESAPKDTLARMIRDCGMDEDFVFYVPVGRKDLYINAMRTVLSRVRKAMKENRKKMQEFKLNVRKVEHNARLGYDKVTMYRTRPGSGVKRSNVYSQLEEMLEFRT